ncbi:glutaredoxin family protein [Tepidibacter hydrothermalis]|uniref:Glutaredoxin domain-containing protein n=1 Tax=Tepidibacter hydrothermalis TaxID=3036126 RepID=A0ABY8EFR5_9FIRM|nr:glutaredoxin domain-containing protein [Tepidibacter hydrothermalis]WFD10332.1 glutaredoxin domain-containing protein [Tepidibacter hydrothermalis]
MNKKIELYSSNTCGYCSMAKDYFNENHLEYIEYNISEDASSRKRLMKMGYMSVPVILIEGEEVLGFDKDKMDKMLKS